MKELGNPTLKKPSSGQSLAEVNPQLASQWHPVNNGDLTPYDVFPKASRKVWWLCPKCGYGWEATINNRAHNSGCPACSGHVVWKGHTDLATVNPKLAAEWHPSKNGNLTPSDVTAGANRKIWWVCSECGHEWCARLISRSHGTGCPKCSGLNLSSERNEKIALAKSTPIPGKSFGDCYPDLVIDWHPTKNGDRTPWNVKPKSGLAVWWKCSVCGNEWVAPVARRSDGKGCPECRKNNISEVLMVPKLGKYLAEADPELSKEWHPIKNGDSTPENISPGSNRAAWWKCSVCGNEWKAAINNRYSGSGCPRCEGMFQTSYGEKAVYYYLRKMMGEEVTSNYKPEGWGGLELDMYVAKYHLAIEFDGWAHGTPLIIERDTRKNVLCKECGINLIRIRYPNLPKLSDCEIYQLPDDSNKSFENAIAFVLKIINTYTNNPADFDINLDRDNIAILELQRAGLRKNSLAIVDPELSRQWHPTKNSHLSPDNFTYGSRQKVWWLCPTCGYSWQASIGNRTTSGAGCPYCVGKVVWKGHNDLATLNPTLANQWHPTKNGNLLPSDVSFKSARKVWWLCPDCGHEWCAYINNRASRGSGCPKCGQTRTQGGSQHILEINSVWQSQWHPTKNGSLTISNLSLGSTRKVWWLCQVCGFEWQASLNNRSKGTNCPVCSGRTLWKGHNDLATLNPMLASQWHPIKNGSWLPSDVKPYCNKKAWWLCPECGHEWQAVIGSRSKGHGCPKCRKTRSTN